MNTDRLEARDLAAAMPDKVAEMSARYEAEAVRLGILPWRGRQTAIGWPNDPEKWAE
jgi:hypothetical protein